MKVIEKMSSQERANLNPLELRKKAKAFALGQIEVQKKEFRRWGVLGEWEKPYLTLNPEYEAQQIGVFANMVKKGLIYRDFKPVYWSPSSRTALAEAELEYRNDHVSPSVYVLFELKELPNLHPELFNAFSAGAQNSKPIYASIWTTTPWTLPANLAICVGDNITYALVEDESDGTQFIVASALIDTLAATCSKKLKTVVENIPGSALVGARAQHPLDDSRQSVILSGAHVTVESGTGLVHTAPGHGQDDFAVCKLNGIQPLCPVDDAGYFTAEAGARFEGKFILKEGNEAVIKALSESPKALLHHHSYTHKYPYDWRTKKPVIIRATRQWFADLRHISHASVSALSNVNVVPRSGLKRLESMLGTRSDWCISRQRSWGVPIPVLYDEATDEPLLAEESIAHIQNLMSAHGSDCWWSMSAQELLAPEYRNDGKTYRKGNDTMDVWFDSGSSWAGVLKERGLPVPADVYLEGSDQHRGWFQSSLLTSVAVHGEAPYKTLVTHGFLLDEKLQKMSKSLGNTIEPTYVIDGGKDKQKAPAYGVDVMRLWVASTDYTDDVIVSDALMASTFNNLRKLRNTSRFMLGVLNDFAPSMHVPDEQLRPLDRYMLHKLSSFVSRATEGYENFSYYTVVHDVLHFVNTDLSAFYLNVLKDRLYSPLPDNAGRRAAQTTISHILDALAKIIAPIAVHTSEDIFQHLPWRKAANQSNAVDSIFCEGWPVVQAHWKDATLATSWDSILEVRTHAYRLIELLRSAEGVSTSSEIDITIYTDAEHPLRSLSKEDLEELLISAECTVLPLEEASNASSAPDELVGPKFKVSIAKAKKHKCARCWRHVAEQPESICGRCAHVTANVPTPL